jgi:hypothetical protein
MTDPAFDLPESRVEAPLHAELARGDALLGTVAPVLRHLVVNEDHSFFGDEIIARTRGMLTDLALQLLDAMASGDAVTPEPAPEALEAVATLLAAQPDLLAHLHALAIEWQLTERLEFRLSVDPVLTPLLQALIGSTDPEVARPAMALLAAQARFAQGQRRMQLAVGELPGDLLHSALLAFQQAVGEAHHEAANAAVATIRRGYDEGRSRLGLMARLLSGLGGGISAALKIGHSGVAIFLSAVALASGQGRETVALTTNEGQALRLALALRAAGLKPASIREQLVAIHPELSLDPAFDGLSMDQAAVLLANAPSGARLAR